MAILKNICLEYTDDIAVEGNEIHAMINKKYASDLQLKLEARGCKLTSISKKYFIWLMSFNVPDSYELKYE